MILTKDAAMQQVESLLHRYGKLNIESVSDTEIVVTGDILINREAIDYQLNKEYNIKIRIPLESDVLPYIIDTGNHIDSSYPHRYSDGRLCLETDTAMRLHYVDGFDLLAWVTDYVEPYYFSYEYYQRYGYFPFGERAHGIEGLLQTYGECFGEIEYAVVCKLMIFAAYGRYRGHNMCPCGSGKKLRSCHGEQLFPFFKNEGMTQIIREDCRQIEEELEKNKQR
jgi:hypothetical protein